MRTKPFVLALATFVGVCCGQDPADGTASSVDETPMTVRTVRDAGILTTIGQLTDVRGIRANQLTGIGLVIGLRGTGDGTPATRETISSLFQNYGLNRQASEFNSGNAALVMVTAELPAFAQPGQQINVRVSSIGDASSLFGGELLQCPLKANDDLVYAVASGQLNASGVSVVGDRARAVRNHPTVGSVSNGALVERPSPSRFVHADGRVYLDLRRQSFEMSNRIAMAINTAFPAPQGAMPLAMSHDAGSVRIHLPRDLDTTQARVSFLSAVESLRVVPASRPVVVVDQKSGTIVIGQNVRISPVAIQIGGFNLTVAETDRVSQPAPFSQGQTATVTRTDVMLEYDPRRDMELLPAATRLEDVVRALNDLQVRSHDLIAALRLIDQAGALHAELIIQ